MIITIINLARQKRILFRLKNNNHNQASTIN
jgi:hypothetical protein